MIARQLYDSNWHTYPYSMSHTYQFYCITAEEDLQIKTSRTLLKLVLCSKLTNLPLQHEYEVEMDNYQFSKKHIIIMSTIHAC